jgi:hypothetical protein
MAETTGFMSSMKAHNREHQFFDKKIEYEEFRNFELLKHNNHRFAFDTEVKKTMNLIEKETDEIIALSQKSCSEIDSKKDAEVLMIDSNAQLESATLQGTKIRDYRITTSTGKKDAEILKVEEFKYTEVKQSEIKLNVSENKAKALTLIAEAEFQSKDKLKLKREDVVKKAQIEILNSLAMNPNVVVSGSSQDDKLSQLVGAGVMTTYLHE